MVQSYMRMLNINMMIFGRGKLKKLYGLGRGNGLIRKRVLYVGFLLWFFGEDSSENLYSVIALITDIEESIAIKRQSHGIA